MQNLYGYIRVSSIDQNEARQLDALSRFDIPARNLFVEKQSGKDFERPKYKQLLKQLRPGDLLILKSIDRIGRNYAEIIDQWRIITRDIGADIKVLDMPLLDTTFAKDLLNTFIADLVLQILSFSAQLERDNIRQRQSEGIAAAKARGVSFGNTAIPLPEDFETIYTDWRSGNINANQAAALCGMSRRTLYEKTKGKRENEYTKPSI